MSAIATLPCGFIIVGLKQDHRIGPPSPGTCQWIQEGHKLLHEAWVNSESTIGLQTIATWHREQTGLAQESVVGLKMGAERMTCQSPLSKVHVRLQPAFPLSGSASFMYILSHLGSWEAGFEFQGY